MMTSYPKSLRTIFRAFGPLLLTLILPVTRAQTTTGPQSLALAGLRTAASQGQWNAIKTDASGNIYLLLDQKDGVRILKSDPTATRVLAQALLGAKGDIGLALALDPSGNVYVAGTTTSTSLAGTTGAAFPNRADTSTNSFVAKFDGNLNPVFVTFAGSGRLAASAVTATADAVFLTGSLFAPTLPVTANGILQTPAYGSSQNGFVERFSADGSMLVYATYLTGAQGDTAPASIVADSADNAYVAGGTSASGYPTVAALVPRIQPPTFGSSAYSGFLTKLSPLGDAITASTFIPGGGVTSLALDPVAQNLLLTGTVALGQFPITNAQTPLVATPYQVLVRLPLDLQSVISSVVLAPGSQSFVTPGANGAAWVNGLLSAPLLPLTALSNTGSAFAERVTSTGTIDQTARFGGLPTTDANHASAPVVFTSLATDPGGQPIFAGSFQPSASADLIATEQYDLPLTQPATALLPSGVADTPVTACNGSLCPGYGAYLAKLNTGVGAASLVFSTGAAPDIVLRNLGSAEAEDLRITATGFSFASSCGTSLPSGSECAIALSGPGSGSLSAEASNASSQTASIPATANSPNPIVFSPHELDFGVQTAAGAPVLRTLTVNNVSQTTQTFASSLDFTARNFLSPFTQTSTDCAAGNTAGLYTLAPGASCHIIFGFSLTGSTPDGPVQYPWTVAVSGTHDVLLTGYAQSAGLSASAGEVDFGTQFVSGLRTGRSLFLSNHSGTSIVHSAVSLPAGSPFSVTDLCPGTLLSHSVCELRLDYRAPAGPSDDSTTLVLDNGLAVLVTGQTMPQPGTSGASSNPNLSVTPATVTFATPVAVTSQSATTQSVTISNTGISAFSLNRNLTGDFTQSGTCPATLAGNTSCMVTITFAPTAPGVRAGLLGVTAGAGTTPVYVTLTGTATSILAGNNGTLDFGAVPVSEPVVQWYKVTQSFPSLTATAGGSWKVFLSEDIGYGHASPAPSAFQTSVTGSCFNCFLGVQFLPTATGAQAGSLSLSSASASIPYSLSLTGTGLPVTGLLVAPGTQDFGIVPVHSTSQTFLFELTNLVSSLSPVTVTGTAVTGDFALSQAATGGSGCSGTLGVAANCFVQVTFSPTATGSHTGSLTFHTSAGAVSVALTGYGSPDPGIALSPNALTFQNVPGTAATQQTITVTNTGSNSVAFGALSTTDPAFTVTGNCPSLAPAATCAIAVSYLPGNAPVSASLNLPGTTTIGGSPTLTNYTVALNGAYTSQNAGLQILPNLTDFGPAIVDAVGFTRSFTLNNLTAKAASVSLSLPRQFVLTTPNPCPTLAAHGSCLFSVTYLPAVSGAATGTISVQATPADGSAALGGLAYFQGYGTPAPGGTLSISGPLSPGTGILDFGQVASGQSVSRVLTLTHNGPATNQPMTIRRTTSLPPFLSTTTCGSPLNSGQSCTLTLTYTANNQVSVGSAPTPAVISTGSVTIESDSAASPNVIPLTASAVPAQVQSPSNSIPNNNFALSQYALTFQPTATGNISPPQTITMTNTGTANLHLIGLKTTSDFTASSNCTQSVSTCTITVAFTPQLQSQTSAVHAATLEITTDSGTSLEFVSLFGLSSPATLGVLPTSLNFGSVVVGQSSVLTVQVTNTGAVPVQFTGITASGDYASSGDCPAAGGSLPPATSCTVRVTFLPAGTGSRTGTLSIASSASTQPLTVALSGVGTQSQLAVAPSSLNFGAIAVNASANLSLTLTNSGTAPVTNLALTITGDYAVTVPCPSATLGAGQSCNVTVTFTPVAVGSRPSVLIVTSSDTNSPINIPLNGTGVQNGSFVLTVNGAGTASATVRQSYPATYGLTVTPTGNFAGGVVFNCTPLSAVPFASCSVLPSSLTLANATPQNATLTINTITAVQRSSLDRGLSRLVLCLLVPLWVAAWRRRRTLPLLAVLPCVLLPGGCGGGANPDFRYTPPGTYQYQVTASSTSGVQITQSVTVTLVVTN